MTNNMQHNVRDYARTDTKREFIIFLAREWMGAVTQHDEDDAAEIGMLFCPQSFTPNMERLTRT